MPLNEKRAVETLMALLRLDGFSGKERPVIDEVRRRLLAAGCPAGAIREDAAARRFGPGFEAGNLIVKLPGPRGVARRMFSGHLDKVPLCRGAEPVLRDGRILPKGATALGGDNRTAVAGMVAVIETLLRERTAHPPLTFLFTVAEEIGLHGAKAVRLRDLGTPAMGFNIDGGDPARLTIGAVGASRWTAEIRGLSAHAGVHPEDGVSAILVAARAVERVAAKGFFGAVRKGRRRGTSNVGVIEGGEATNQVADRVLLRGECRSHQPAFLRRIGKAYADAFASAARSVRSTSGARGTVDFRIDSDYAAFCLARTAPVVRAARAAARTVGLRAETGVSDGGLDANPLNARGIPTVTLGMGQHEPHSLKEYVDVAEFLAGCRLALALAAGA